MVFFLSRAPVVGYGVLCVCVCAVCAVCVVSACACACVVCVSVCAVCAVCVLCVFGVFGQCASEHLNSKRLNTETLKHLNT